MLFDSPSTFGRAFRIVTFGESHGPAVGVVIDGVKPDLPFDLETVQSATVGILVGPSQPPGSCNQR